MPTEVIDCTSGFPREREEATARRLRDGGVIAFPTESYYGLAAAPASARGLDLLLALKGERDGKPIPLVLASASDASLVAATLPPVFETLARLFWPGPLTLVVPARAELDATITGGTRTVGLRVSSHPVARAVAALAGGVVTATSANPAGARPPVLASEVLAYFEDALDLVLDGGRTPGGLASTVLDLTATPPRLVRPGPIPEERLREILGSLDTAPGRS